MKIMEMRALRGPNYYSRHPVIFMKLDIGELEYKPTDLVLNFKENANIMMPTLYEHSCSPGVIGGFYERLVRGTWAGHVVEHVAIELQCLIGQEVSFGKTFTLSEKGTYNLVFRYIDEHVGLKAGEMAVDIVEKLFQGIITDLEPLLLELINIKEHCMLGPSTASILNEAQRRGIPYFRLNDDSYIQLGQGIYQRRFQATMVDSTSAIAVEIADDKELTKELLSSMGIPVAKGYSVKDFKEAEEAVVSIGYPVVVKPLTGNHGRGITININSSEELKAALEKSERVCDKSIVEKYLPGYDYRILVIDGKFVAAAFREPAFVIGNGKNTIKQLIEQINEDPLRGIGHEKSLTKITLDSMTDRQLKIQNLTLESIIPKDKKVYIKATANLSSGGTATDVTDSVHPRNRLTAERISQIIGLDICGIDIIADSLETPFKDQNCGVLEVNAAPGFRMHLNPSNGAPRNIASNVVDMLFPEGSKHSVPIIAVTGTNGKTTTTRLINHILKVNGHRVGMTSTDCVTINDVPILFGDYSGPGGAEKVLKDSTIDHAVLEVARGGILRRGLGFKESDIGVLLNITADHLGEGGIDTLEHLTRLKSTVTEAVKETGYAVFNADDPLVLLCVERTKANPVLFSKNPKNEALAINKKKGNINVTIHEDLIIVEQKGQSLPIANVVDIPITFGGKASFNTENVLAAVAVTYALGLKQEEIRKGLINFNPSLDQSRGRMNIVDMGQFKVLIDYGHNPGAVLATGEFINSLTPGRKIRMASSVGNRKDESIIEFAEALSKYYHHIIICDPDIRQRKLGETADMVKQGLINNGFNSDMITIIHEEREATRAALEMAEKDDLVILQVDNLDQVIKDVFEFKEKLEELI